jgi:uncharacterized protein YcbX
VNGPIDIGRVTDLTRYPVKSMAGTPLETGPLGWHGIEGDRRFAFRRVGEKGDFPWLTASKLPALILYRPEDSHQNGAEPRPTQVRTPTGALLPLDGPELCAELAERFGSAVELMQLKQGIFDEAPVSVISLATIAGIEEMTGLELDRRRFRANIVVDTPRTESFLENEWVGRMLVFGDDPDGPAVHVTARDPRCVMINLDPETAEQDARVLKTVVRLNQNDAGVYATVVRRGTIRIGDRVRLVTARG